jgi:phosphatidylserine/phosphatidylglycerophosphate/cardiolipin synthase-like enzyme
VIGLKISGSSGPLTVQAIAGTNVVLLGVDHNRDLMAGVHGFGIERLDHTEGEQRWLTNQLRFPGVGAQWGTNFNPLQTFVWGDYRVKPDHVYSYVVHTMVGQPGSELESRDSVTVQVQTEHPDMHGVWFNRGVFASQAYAERFGNKPPDQVPNNAAWQWLSRGLEEALLAFIGQAADASWELDGAFYEFQHPAILDAFAVAARAGATVRLVVDANNPKNHTAVTDAGIDGLIKTWRANAVIPHNKFLVASQDGTPVAVWTGSTNITDNGLFGQSNVGHAVRDPDLAAKYLTYWQQLTADPRYSTLNDWVDANNPTPDSWGTGTNVVFSPHTHTTPLDNYAALFGAANELACGTFPFTLDSRFGKLLPGQHAAIRWLLFENPTDAKKAAATVTDPNTVLVAGAFLPADALAGFLPELKNPLSNNVEYIHSKYLLLDPIGDDPIVITGSANFSTASTNRNDENMLVIRGNSTVAEIYFTEFFRLFAHYRFRYFLQLQPPQPTPGPETNTEAPVGLDPSDNWWPKYFDEPNRVRQRQLLAGTA